MSKEKAAAHANEPAVLCCQRPKGTVISEADLEDPTIFVDLQDSGLLTIPGGSLTVGEVLGRTLTADVEALTALDAGVLDGGADAVAVASVPAPDRAAPAAPQTAPARIGNAPGTVTLHVDSLQGLDLSFPTDWPAFLQAPPADAPVLPGAPAYPGAPAPWAKPAGIPEGQDFPAAAAPERKDRILRSLTHKYYTVKDVVIGGSTAFASGVLTIDSALTGKARDCSPIVKKVELDVIRPGEDRHILTNTIMDVIPVAVKRLGRIGEGETAVLDRVVFCLTGLDEQGVQIHEFGACDGYLDEKVAFGRPGAPDTGDIIVRVNVVVAKNTGMERRGPLAAHTACDIIIQSVRDVLKVTDASASSVKTYQDVRRYGLPRVCLIKEIMGQGAMHDNILLPNEPAGVSGGQKNVDLGNVPVMLTTNEVRDGGIHALTCIGPATKETTRHYFREPLVHTLATDDEIDLVGVIFIGSPQVNDEKMYVSERLGAWIESLDLDGAIVTTEGFGNNHIDFVGNIAAIGSRDVPVVGVTYSAYQGQLVVGNEYMDAMIEINKDANGFENEVLSCNSICPEDAARASLMLKTKMAGIPIAPAERKWSQTVIDANQQLVDLKLGK
jgi:D-proline reductase (dithiol) PrdA